MKNTYILDTSVIVHDPEILEELENSKIIIPIVVLEELDKLKSQYTLVGANARQFLKILDNLTTSYTGSVTLNNNSILIIDTNNYKSMGQDNNYGDNKILSCAFEVNKESDNVILLTRDYNLRIRARVLNIKAEDYNKDVVLSEESELYSGTKVLEVDAKEIRSLYDNEVICVDENWVKEHKVYPNQFILLKCANGSTSATCRFYEDYTLKLLSGKNKAFGLSTKNKEQSYALELLFDDNVKLVTLSGIAGTGKTIMSVAAALEQVINEKKYEKFFITKSIETVGKDIGALPGTKLEKMAPFIQSIMDNVGSLFNKTKKKSSIKKPTLNKKGVEENEIIQDPYLSLLLDNGVIEVESLAYMRGRSIDNAFILIDEAQNLTQKEIKTIISRAGHNTKIVCTGDLDQIDVNNLNIFNNGLTYLVERFKPYGIAGHVALVKGERSELATIASKIL